MTLKSDILIVKQKYSKNCKERIDFEKNVIKKYGFMFNPVNLNKLNADDFKSFLLIQNNKHWDSIHRYGNILTRDMDRLKYVLYVLLDESKLLTERFDLIFPKNKPNLIKGFGRATLTPILLVVYPEKYAVYNSVVEKRMKDLGEFPNINGKNLVDTYLIINKKINDIAKQNNISLWQMDDVWWYGVEGKLPLEDGAHR